MKYIIVPYCIIAQQNIEGNVKPKTLNNSVA